MTSIKFKKIAQILFLTRLPPFPNGQSFGLALRAMAPRLVPFSHHQTFSHLLFRFFYSIKPAIAAPKVISLSQETIFQFIPI